MSDSIRATNPSDSRTPRLAPAIRPAAPLLNVMFPIWMLMLFPTWLWLIILPVNFIIDSAVVTIAAKACKAESIFHLWKQSILKVWAFGFLSDIAGALVVWGVWAICDLLFDDMGLGLFPSVTLTAIPGVIAAGVLIYLLNRRFTFKNADLPDHTARVLCLALAIFTAPYTMMIPLYG